MRGPQRHRADPGQILVIFAAATVLLIAFLAAAVDVGHLLSQRRGVQNAADAAALAVAHAVYTGVTDAGTLNQIAAYYVRQNGYDAAPAVTLDLPNKRVTVDVRADVPKFFVAAVYPGDWRVGAHAVAALEPVPKDYGLLALQETGNPINLTGNVDIHVAGGGAMSNGGMRCTGNGALTADTTVDANKGFSKTGNCGFDGALGETPNAPVVEDPLRQVPPPPKPAKPSLGSPVSCTQSGSRYTCPPGRMTTGISASGNNVVIEFAAGDHQVIGADISASGNNPTIILNPGTYYFSNADLRLTGNNGTLIMRPGTYTFYMENGSMVFTGNAGGYQATNTSATFYFKDSTVDFTGNVATDIPPGIYYFDGKGPRLTGNQKVTGWEVFFYFDNGASWDNTGNTGYDFRAAEQPLYPGMPPGLLMFSARDNATEFKMTGNANTFLRGVVYLPKAQLRMTGNASGVWAEGQLIVNSLSNVGNTDVTVKYKKYVDVEVPAVFLVE
ncbi:MAG: pilus assembly protein TadG-related protein [Sphaerobacter sp.]|nr:pilus assembly protein TadG-related protein [Sphaerobacter sp.]